MKKWVLIALSVLAVGAGGWLYASGTLGLEGRNLNAPDGTSGAMQSTKNGDFELRRPAVSVVSVHEAAFEAHVLATGSIVAREKILVAPEISGQRIVKLLADIGDTVAAGQTLALLATGNLDAQLAQNDAAKARASAARAQAVSLIAEAEAARLEADAALERAERLQASGNLARSVYDQRLAAARTAAAKLAAARDGLKAASADIAEAAARRRELNWQIGRAKVTAPAGGLISRRLGQIGAMTSPVAMFHIIRDGEFELDAEVPAPALAKLRAGQGAVVQLADGRQHRGRVRLISPEIDPATRLGTVRVYLGARGASGTLRLGMFARARIEIAARTGLSIPASAVMYDGREVFVMAAAGDKARRAPIRVGLATDARIEIIAGLKAGDLVISKAGTFLRDGDLIRPIFVPTTQVTARRQN